MVFGLPGDRSEQISSGVKSFYDTFWPAYLPSKEDIDETRQHLQKIIPNRTWEHILDAGCGLGICTVVLSEMGRKVIGLDISPQSLGLAKALAKELGKNNVEFQEGNLMNLPYDDETFDLILCWGVLMYVPAADKVFSELSRCLRNGGTLVVAVHRKSALTPLHDTIRRICLRVPGFARRFTIKSMALSVKAVATILNRRPDRYDLSFEGKVEDFYFVPFKRFFAVSEVFELFRIHRMSSEILMEYTGRFKNTSSVIIGGHK